MVGSILVFRDGSTNGNDVKAQFVRQKHKADKYNLNISGISGEAFLPCSGSAPYSRAPLSAGGLIPTFPWVLVGEGLLLWETALIPAFSFS